MGEGWVVVMVCFGGSVGESMRCVWRSLGVGRGVLGMKVWGGCVFRGASGWMDEFLTSGIV